MDIELIRKNMTENSGRRIEYHPVLDSTNTYLMRLASENAAALFGTVIIAGWQTGGRGRFARSFFSPPGAGLYMSVLLPCPGYDGLPFTITAGVAAAESVEAVSGIGTQIKWVNDIMAGGKKLGGILCESSADATGVRYIVAGIGINLTDAGFPADIRDIAVSLDRLGGHAAPERLAAEILDRLDYYTARDRDEIIAKYRSRMMLTGSYVRFSGAGSGEGTVTGVDDDGRLLVMTSSGIKALNSGEITVKR